MPNPSIYILRSYRPSIYYIYVYIFLFHFLAYIILCVLLKCRIRRKDGLYFKQYNILFRYCSGRNSSIAMLVYSQRVSVPPSCFYRYRYWRFIHQERWQWRTYVYIIYYSHKWCNVNNKITKYLPSRLHRR